MDENEKRIKTIESRISAVEREYQNSWAHGSRSEYEERFKIHISNMIFSKIWVIIAGIIAAFGVAITVYLDLALDKKVTTATNNSEIKLKTSISKEFLVIQQNEAKRINDLIEGFDWRQSHDFGYIYRNLAQLFWDDKTIDQDAKKRWIKQVLKLAMEKLEKANVKNSVKGETLWELGNLSYQLPKKYRLGTEDPEIAAIYYSKAIKLYKKLQISKGWRGGAYEDLSEVQLSLANLHKGTDIGKAYSEKSINSKKLALRDYEEHVSKENSWVNASIIRLKKELEKDHIDANDT